MTSVFNVCTGENITLNALVNAIIELSSSNLRVIYTSAKAGNIRYNLADVSQAKTFGQH